MKIAIVSPYSWAHPGGVNNHIQGLSRELVRRGHGVTVIAPDAGQAPAGMVYLRAGRSVPVPANGSIAHIAPFPGTGSRVRRALAEGDFDVVHVHEPLVPSVSTSAVLGSTGRVVGTFHAAGEKRSFIYGAAKLFFKNVHERLDHLIAVSEPARALASRYFPGDYETIPNGVDTRRFAPGGPRPAALKSTRGPIVLFVGRNEPRKGVGVLLEAFGSVARDVPGSMLVVAGSGFEEDKLKRRLAPAARDSVTVAGFVSDDELPSYYAAADVFCAPALGGESFGVVLIEALACGTPVVASDIPGYSAVLEQTGGGVLFKSGDAADLARTLSRLLLDENRRDNLAKEGLERVGEFSWERLAERLESVYSG